MPRANRPNRGGKRVGAGRPKGSRAKVQSEVRQLALAGDFGREALDTLVSIMRNKETPPATRVSACALLLDRAYGKALLPVSLDLKFRAEDLSDDDLACIIAGGTIHGSVGNGHAVEHGRHSAARPPLAR
jgi:hypothetical protein